MTPGKPDSVTVFRGYALPWFLQVLPIIPVIDCSDHMPLSHISSWPPYKRPSRIPSSRIPPLASESIPRVAIHIDVSTSPLSSVTIHYVPRTTLLFIRHSIEMKKSAVFFISRHTSQAKPRKSFPEMKKLHCFSISGTRQTARAIFYECSKMAVPNMPVSVHKAPSNGTRCTF